MGVDNSVDGQRPRSLERIDGIPTIDSTVPQHITDSIIDSEDLPTHLPKLGSSIIEDFIVEKIQEGFIEPEAVAETFVHEGYPERIEQYLQELEEQSESVDWNRIFSFRDFLDVKSTIASEMRALGIPTEQISRVIHMRMQLTNSVGVSHLDEESIYLSKLQAVRKALDYQKVFGTNVSIEDILRTLMTVNAGHELGHMIDHITPGFAYNHIPSDPSWFKDGKTAEKKKERFAEYWGRVALVGDEERNQMRQREWALQVAKANQVWGSVRGYNVTHEPKVELIKIFSTIKRTLVSDYGQALSFLESRIGNYGNTAAENYASAYPREIVSAAVRWQ